MLCELADFQNNWWLSFPIIRVAFRSHHSQFPKINAGKSEPVRYPLDMKTQK